MLGRAYRTSGEIANADIVMNDTFWVGVYPGLNEDSLRYMVDTISKFINWATAGQTTRKACGLYNVVLIGEY